jgi:hypothetical protein
MMQSDLHDEESDPSNEMHVVDGGSKRARANQEGIWRFNQRQKEGTCSLGQNKARVGVYGAFSVIYLRYALLEEFEEMAVVGIYLSGLLRTLFFCRPPALFSDMGIPPSSLSACQLPSLFTTTTTTIKSELFV